SEDGIEQYEDEKQGQGYDEKQPSAGALQILELPTPDDVIPCWQRHFSGDPFLRLVDKRPQVSAAYIRFYYDAAMNIFTTDLRRSFFYHYPRELFEWN